MSWVVDVPAEHELPGLAQLKRAVEDETYRDYGTPAEHQASLDRYCSVDFLRVLLEEQVLVVGRRGPGGQIAGMAALDPGRQPPLLHSVYCLPRHQGLGSALLARLAALLDESSQVRVEVFERNVVGLDYFTRRGFRPTGQTRPSQSYNGALLVELTGLVQDVRRCLVPAP